MHQIAAFCPKRCCRPTRRGKSTWSARSKRGLSRTAISPASTALASSTGIAPAGCFTYGREARSDLDGTNAITRGRSRGRNRIEKVLDKPC